MPFRAMFAAALSLLALVNAAEAEQLQVLAAGSLREVLAEIGGQYSKATGVEVTTTFGPSGVLRERIEKGERADLFASADTKDASRLPPGRRGEVSFRAGRPRADAQLTKYRKNEPGSLCTRYHIGPDPVV
jgi:accessory colonization factor AcfC